MNMHIVKEFDVNLYIHKCIEHKELSLAQVKYARFFPISCLFLSKYFNRVSGSLPKLEANMSDKKLIATLKMLDAILPSNHFPAAVQVRNIWRRKKKERKKENKPYLCIFATHLFI
jgi:hypothetical protein